MKSATSDKASLPTVRKLRRLAAAVTTACVLATSTSAWAKPACYSAAEYDAEQAVRLHTELMVIGLTCNAIETASSSPSISSSPPRTALP